MCKKDKQENDDKPNRGEIIQCRKLFQKYVANHKYTDENIGEIYSDLGMIYTNGYGVKPNYKKAVEYYTIATEKCGTDCSRELSQFTKTKFGYKLNK